MAITFSARPYFLAPAKLSSGAGSGGEHARLTENINRTLQVTEELNFVDIQLYSS